MFSSRRISPALVLLGGLCFALGLGSESLSQQPKPDDDKAVRATIDKLGGSVRPAFRGSKELEVEFNLRGQDLTDEGLAHVAKLKNVVSLNLRDTKITGKGLAHLKGMTSLRQLHLEKTALTDEGTENLAGLTNLEYLNLYGTKVGDKALSNLSGLVKLKSLYLWQTNVTDEGVAKLEKALPKLDINRGVDVAKLPTTPKNPPVAKAVALKWTKFAGKKPPKSQLGTAIRVVFENKRKQPVKLYWISYRDEQTLYGVIEPGKKREQNTYSKATWLITGEDDKPLGYFLTGDNLENTAVIPEK